MAILKACNILKPQPIGKAGCHARVGVGGHVNKKGK